MIERVPVEEHKEWDEPATMTDVFQYYMEGLKFSGRAWRRSKIATWIAAFASVTSVATIIALVLILF